MSHAKLSASGAHRWINCPGSVRLEALCPDESSFNADEGTAAHSLAEMCLTQNRPASDFIGRIIRVDDRQFEVDEDMSTNVQSYVDFVTGLPGDVKLFEQRVDYSHAIGQPDSFGTSDAIVIDTAAKRITVVDLKYGMRLVYAENNPQGLLYAIGALPIAGLFAPEIDEVEIVIHQPRKDHIDRWVVTRDTIDVWVRDFGTAAALTTVEDAPLVPSEKACQYCKAKATCPALGALVNEYTTQDKDFLPWEDLTEDTIAHPSWNLSDVLPKIELIEAWCEAVKAEAYKRLSTGQAVKGFKLVKGKEGNRKWFDTDVVESAFQALHIPDEQIYKKTVISPTQAEKVLKTNPAAWAKLEGYIERAEAKLVMVPETDPKPAVAIAQFQDLTAGGGH